MEGGRSRPDCFTDEPGPRAAQTAAQNAKASLRMTHKFNRKFREAANSGCNVHVSLSRDSR